MLFSQAIMPVHRSVAGPRQHTSVSPQRDPFKNANNGYEEHYVLGKRMRDDQNIRISAKPGKLFCDIFGSSTPAQVHEAWLPDLLNHLAQCSDHAQEENIETPSEITLSKAKHFLEIISSCVKDRPEIYLMTERRIAVDFRVPASRCGALFVIEHDGSGVLYYRSERSRGRLRVDDSSDLLNEGGLIALKRVGIR